MSVVFVPAPCSPYGEGAFYGEGALAFALSSAILPGLPPPPMNPQTRHVAEREADQNRNQWVLADLPRNGSGRATTRIHDVLRHSARLRPGLLCRFACIAQHFFRLTDRRRGS